MHTDFYSFVSYSTRIIDYTQLSLSFNCFTETGMTPPVSGGDETIGRENVIYNGGRPH